MYGYGDTLCLQASWNHTQKKTKRYKEQEAVKVALYLKQIETIPVEKIAYVDETGIDIYLQREYGYSLKGQKIEGKVSGRKYKRVGIVAAQMNKKINAPLQYDGTMDSVLFEQWIYECLMPALPEKSVIIMDNASLSSQEKTHTTSGGCRTQTDFFTALFS